MRFNRLGYRKKALLAMKGEGDSYRFRIECENGGVSAALARWVYRHPSRWKEGSRIEVEALQCLRFASDEWVFDYLWEELRARKHEEIGDWILVALATHSTKDMDSEVRELIGLYQDPTANPLTRGSVIFVLNSRATEMTWEKQDKSCPELWQAIRDACRQALYDEDNAYARAGGCWLAKNFGGFEDRLAELKHDHTQTVGGKVSDHARD